jgi:hypothetical protein
MASLDRLDVLADKLEQSGDDPFRLTLVRCAQRFKRSWLELATALHELQARRGFERWGYSDMHDYCNKELSIRPSTVDKLLLSYGTVQRHAPEMLEPSRAPRDVPSFDAVDYFARALGREEAPGKRLDAAPEVIDKLRAAVFDEGRSLPELRGEFGPLLRPKAAETDEPASRARATAARLLGLLEQLKEQLTEARIGRTAAALEALVRDLDALAPHKPERAETANRTARARKKEPA